MDNLFVRSSTSFHHLPDEIIHKIFTYLDIQSIKNSSLVAKRFANIVATSSVLLNNFKLKLEGNFFLNRALVMEVVYLKRFFNELHLSGISGNHNVLIAIFRKFGWQVTKLTINNSKIDDFTFREILKLCPIIKEIHLLEVSIIKKLPAIHSVCLTSLKILKINYCDWQLFKFFTRSQIDNLAVKNYLDEGNRKNLVTFLENQHKLKELLLHGTSFRTLFHYSDVNENCSFSLESFDIDNGIGKNYESVNWNATAFLSMHCETLKNVDISGPHNEHVTAFALLNLEHLQSMTLDVRGLPKNHDFYQSIAEQPKNFTLKDLKLRGFFFQQEFIKTIFLRYPMVQTLEINDWSNSSMSALLYFISQNLTNLENLSITEISNSENIKLRSLKNLTVHYIRNARKLADFIIRNDSVDNLNIGLMYIGQIPEFIMDFRDLNNVKHLTVGGNKTALRKILSLIKAEAPQRLTTLELALIGEEKNAVGSRKALKFNLPFDPIDLNLKFNILM